MKNNNLNLCRIGWTNLTLSTQNPCTRFSGPPQALAACNTSLEFINHKVGLPPKKSGFHQEMGVSQNRGTPKSSMFIGFSLINHLFWGTHLWKAPDNCVTGMNDQECY